MLDAVISTSQSLYEHAAKAWLEDFVTGLIGRVDLRSGVMDLVNAGHEAPYLARGSLVTDVRLPGDPPLGLFGDTTYGISQLGPQPRDRDRVVHPREAVRDCPQRPAARKEGLPL